MITLYLPKKARIAAPTRPFRLHLPGTAKPSFRVLHGDYEDVLERGRVDTLISDPPFHARVHDGHDKGVREMSADGANRKSLSYKAWSDTEVARFVESWSPRVRGWMVIMSDHKLQRDWERRLEQAGRYVFAPLPFVARGSRVRRQGDGPSSWTTWITVARPKTAEMAGWGTLRGEYTLPAKEKLLMTGAKPLWIMEQLVLDYSKPGNLIVDPCMGSGTTLLAAVQNGRRAIGCDVSLDAYNLTLERLSTRKAA